MPTIKQFANLWNALDSLVGGVVFLDAYSGSAQTGISATTPAKFGTVRQDTHNSFSASGGTYLVPGDGVYFINATLDSTETAARRAVLIVNGDAVAAGPTTTGAGTCGLWTARRLTKNDVIAIGMSGASTTSGDTLGCRLQISGPAADIRPVSSVKTGFILGTGGGVYYVDATTKAVSLLFGSGAGWMVTVDAVTGVYYAHQAGTTTARVSVDGGQTWNSTTTSNSPTLVSFSVTNGEYLRNSTGSGWEAWPSFTAATYSTQYAGQLSYSSQPHPEYAFSVNDQTSVGRKAPGVALATVKLNSAFGYTAHAFSGRTPGGVYFACVWTYGGGAKLLRSTDWTSWTAVHTRTGYEQVSIPIQTASGALIAMVHGYASSPTMTAIRSTDNGLTWSVIAVSANSQYVAYCPVLVVVEGTIFICTGTSSGLSQMYYSTNDGLSWTSAGNFLNGSVASYNAVPVRRIS